MYNGVIALIVGEAWLFGSVSLLGEQASQVIASR
jgi:hypothetical protein